MISEELTQEAKEYLNKRWKELDNIDSITKVNLILAELRGMGIAVFVSRDFQVPIRSFSIKQGVPEYHV